MHLGTYLRRERKERGHETERLSRKSGVDIQRIHKLERDPSRVRVDAVFNLVHALGLKVFIYPEGYPQRRDYLDLGDPDQTRFEIADLIKTLRKRKGIYQKDIAKAVGLSPLAVGQWEKYGFTSTTDKFIEVMRFLGCGVDVSRSTASKDWVEGISITHPDK